MTAVVRANAPEKSPARDELAKSDASERVVTYLPDNSLRRGYFSVFGDIVRELSRTRWLTYQLFKRDVVSFYKQSLLGAFWIVFVPLVTLGTFVLLKGSGVVAVGKLDAPYSVFAVLGTAVWQLFSQGLVAGANSLVLGGDLITRINFSKKSLVIASMGRSVVSFLVLVLLSLALVAGHALSGWHYRPTVGILLLPLALLPMLLLTLGLSFYLALLNGIVRDIGTMLSMLVTFLMLLTPVLYDRPEPDGTAAWSARALASLTDYNPLYYLVSAPRDLVLRGSITELSGFLASSAFALAVFLIGIVGFHLTETRIAERI
jgi:lipopolysaccharide transport system permease protein